MRSSLAVAVATILFLSGAPSAMASGIYLAQYIGTYVWRPMAEWHGGYSGIEVHNEGREFLAITDRGRIVAGSLQRKNGAIVGVSDLKQQLLLDPKGQPPKPYSQDAEGLALGRDGKLHVSFEGQHRVWRYAVPGGKATALPRHKRFKRMQRNASLEALAIDQRGWLYTLPERSGAEHRPFPVFRYNGKRWSIPFKLARIDGFLPVGMDFDPNGKLYLLERMFNGIGFRSRVRRFTVTPDGLRDQEVLLQTFIGEYDNLEGLSVWQDSDGDMRLTMIADDNFQLFQRTEIVEYKVAP